MADNTKRPQITISERSRDVLENIRNMLDQESEAATQSGDTFSARIITNLLDQVERELSRVNNFTRRTRVASRRKIIKQQRKAAAATAAAGASSTDNTKSA